MIKPTTVFMKWQLLIGSAFVFIAGAPLALSPENTKTLFAWTINPPLLTAAFLGASYWASACLGVLAARQPVWARTRLAVPTSFTFTALTLLATLLHIDRFHLNSPDVTAVLFAWVWLTIYAGVPLSLAVVLVHQMRAPGGDPPRQAPLPGWLRAALGVLGAAGLVYGAALFISSSAAAPLWGWALTPLTARAVAAWLIAFGLVAEQVVLENDAVRSRPVMIMFVAFGVLQSIALARFAGDLAWGEPRGWVYVLLIIAALALGGAGWLLARRAPASEV